MRCEVCGREIIGPPLYRVIERARMTVCPGCARFGSSDWNPSKPSFPRARAKPKPRSEVEALENLALVEDYGEKIRKTRQRMKMTVEDLGTKINEKVSVIKKLEKEELIPDRKVLQKLRNTLKIELLIAEEAPSTLRPSKPSRGRTLGDIIKLRGELEEASESEKT